MDVAFLINLNKAYNKGWKQNWNYDPEYESFSHQFRQYMKTSWTALTKF